MARATATTRAPGVATPARAALVGSTCGVGAAGAHSLAMDGAVSPATAALVALAGLTAGPLLVRRPTLPVLLAGTLALQLVGHLAMHLAGGGGAADDAGHAAGHSGHAAGHAGHAAETTAAAATHGGLEMLVGHLAAALAAALLARGADRALVTVLRDLFVSGLVLAPAPVLPSWPGQAPVWRDSVLPALRLPADATDSRGPPARPALSTSPA